MSRHLNSWSSYLAKIHEIIQNNTIYIVCKGCGNSGSPLELGRRKAKVYAKAPLHRDLEHWFEIHSECPGGPDKFNIGYSKTPNWDQSTLADPVQSAVRLEILKS
jgi:hypothetical protein